jgi:acetoin:2,6-dichlorophenolindophenol oxidoreductase subunit alpha
VTAIDEPRVAAVPLEQLYGTMARIRAFETKAMELFGEKHIRGSVHPYIGMEAIAVGVCSVLDESDFITSTHRGHGHCIAKGLELRPMMAEITGRATGYCKGKGGSMHITAMRHGMLGADAIVGGSLAIAVGAAYSLRLQGKDSVTVAFFGDGAANQGIFHEAANLASVLSAPVIFVCENNQWAISMPIAKAINVEDVAIRSAGYGFPGEVVDGNDVVAGREVAARAVDRARRGDGPTLIEAKTYRITPHSAATPNDSRSPDELAFWREKDPIERFARFLVEGGHVSEERLAGLAAEAHAAVEDAAAYALDCPFPEVSEAETDVYAPSDWQRPGRLS